MALHLVHKTKPLPVLFARGVRKNKSIPRARVRAHREKRTKVRSCNENRVCMATRNGRLKSQQVFLLWVK